MKMCDPEENHFTWWTQEKDRHMQELNFGCLQKLNEMNFPGTPFSEKVPRDCRSTESNATSRPKKAEIRGM